MNRALHVALALSAGGALVGCGIALQRDLHTVKPAEVVYDDMCGLQEYFDALHDLTIQPPEAVFERELAGKNDKALGGRIRYRFTTDFQLHYLHELLAKNWKRLPAPLMSAKEVDLEVAWAEKAGVRRVITEEPATLEADHKTYELPYQVCLSDFLFGSDLYDTRRTVLQLPPPAPSRFSKKPSGPALAAALKTVDAGAPVVAPTPPTAPVTAAGTPPAAVGLPAPASVTPADAGAAAQ